MTYTLAQRYDLTGKTALITGGSGRLGLQMADALGQAGARIMLCARQPDRLEAATADLQSVGIDTRWVAADCAVQADLQKLVQETLHRMGDVDILVNNAGSPWHAPALSDPAQAWDQVMNLKLRGYFLLSQLLGQHSMIGRRSGRIINIAPVAGWVDKPSALARLASHTAQGAVISLTRALACEWGPHNITVNAIGPGVFASAMGTETLLSPNLDKLETQVPLQRLGDDEDLKGVTLLLASDAGKYITGQWLAVDGGLGAARFMANGV